MEPEGQPSIQRSRMVAVWQVEQSSLCINHILKEKKFPSMVLQCHQGHSPVVVWPGSPSTWIQSFPFFPQPG